MKDWLLQRNTNARQIGSLKRVEMNHSRNDPLQVEIIQSYRTK